MSNDKVRATILVVDNEPSMIEAYRELLGADYHLITAYNGQEALSKFENAKVDLIVLDLEMPGLSGVEFLQRIRNRKDGRQNVAVVIVSGSDLNGSINLRKLRINALISKPFDIEAFLKEIREVLRSADGRV